jgi:hypothetical protein
VGGTQHSPTSFKGEADHLVYGESLDQDATVIAGYSDPDQYCVYP